MAQSVDTKVVELKFNNDNFADKVDSTLIKLQQLNKNLDTVGVSDPFKNLSKNVKDVDVSGINDGVKEIHASFSKLDVVATTALANITNSVVNLGKKMVANLVSPIKKGILQGGLARARNIEQATFSFEGQKIGKSKGNESLSYYKEVMDAVLGTSYSYDVAARAASQLAASNVGVEKSMRKLADGTKIESKVLNADMTKALLGIAGVASMTGRSFDDVSRVFTKVAGNNRVYAQDLQSFSAMGLNAAAVLGSQMGKTEEQIYEMVKKGEIHFAEFSKAMSDAFGAHAKDSTLMFQGALDDVNAALARIGADFYGPALNAGRDILNSVTPLVDAIHSKLNPALDATNGIMGKASKSLSQYLDMLSYMIEMFPKMDRSLMGDWILEHMNAWTNIADLYGRGNLKDAVEQLEQVSKKWKGMDGQGINGKQMIADYYSAASNVSLIAKYLKISDKEAQKLVDDGKVGSKEIATIVDGMIDDGTVGFNEFYKAFHKLWSESEKLMNNPKSTDFFNEYVRQAIRAEEPSERFNKHLQTFASILNGIKSLASSVGKILGGFADIFLSLAGHLKPLGNLLVKAAEETAKFVVYIADFIATSESFSSVIDSIVHVISKFFELLNVSKLAQLALYSLGKVFDFIAKAIDTIQRGVATVIGVISDLFGKIVDKINSVVSSSEELAKVLQSIKQAGIVVMIINLAAMLARPIEMLDALSGSIKNVGKSIGKVFDNIASVFESIAGLAGKIGKVLDEVRESLVKFQELIVATAIFEIGIAIAVLAGAFYLLTKIDTSKMENFAVALVSFGAVVGTILAIPKLFKNITTVRKAWEKSVNNIKDIGKAFLMMAASVAIIAAAIVRLSKIDKGSLLAATGVVETLLITMAVIAKLLSGTVTTTRSKGLKSLWSGQATKTSTSMTKGLLGLVAMAEAVNILAKALAKVAAINDIDAMVTAFAVIEMLMLSMAGIVKFLSKQKPDKMARGVGVLLAMALAVRMLTKPMIILSEIASSNSEGLWTAVNAIGALLVVMGLLTKLLSGSEGLVKAGISILLIAAAMKILGEVVMAFSSLDSETMVLSIVGLCWALGSLVLALALIDEKGVLAKAVALLIIAKTMEILSGVILDFGSNIEQSFGGIAALAVALGVLAGACLLFKKVPITGILKLFLTLALGAVIVAAFGAAIGVFGVGIGVFGVGLGILAVGLKQIGEVIPQLLGIMVIFGVALALMGTVGAPAILVIIGLAGAFLLLGAAMMLIGTGLNDTAAAIKILTEMKGELGDTVKQITEFITKLKKMTDDADKIGESFMTIAKPLKSIRTSAEELTKHIEKLSKSYTDMIGKTSECMSSLADSLTAISQLNQDSFSEATEAVKGFVDSLKGIQNDAETVATTATSISDSLEGMKGTFELVKETIKQFKHTSTKVFDELGASLSGIADPLTTLNTLKDDLATLSSDLTEFITSLSVLKDKSALVQEGAVSISNALHSIENAARVTKDSFAGLTQNTADILSQMGTGLTNMGSGFETILKVKDQLDSAASSIESFYKKLESLNSTATTIAQGTKQVTSAVKMLGEAAKKTASLSKQGMNDSGSAMVDGLIGGMTNKKSELETKVTSMLDGIGRKIKNKQSAWRDIGAHLIKGMINGISNQQYALEQQVKALEEKAERAVKAKAEIKSPSKVWAKIGSFMGQGLINGIANSEHGVKVAALGLASVSEDAISSAIYSISDAINSDLDVTPTITPVVDLSNISAASGFISNSFARNQAIGISRLMNSSPNALAYAADSIVNGIASQNQNGSIDPAMIYEAVRQGASDAEIRGITLNGRELKRGLRDMGVVTR